MRVQGAILVSALLIAASIVVSNLHIAVPLAVPGGGGVLVVNNLTGTARVCLVFACAPADERNEPFQWPRQ
jgi:hypothetical protein